MIKDKISSQEIIDLVSSKASVSKRAAEEFLKVMIASIEEALMAGEVVKIKNFGTFKLQWNEPRKSVNVHTGEDIIIPGYSKVTFVPDVILKNVVNEPFAHLEPVVLDENDEMKELVVDEVALDPLRVLNEQAADIKGLLADIQALSPKKKQDVIIDETLPVKEVKPDLNRVEIQDYDLSSLENAELTQKNIQAEELSPIVEKKEDVSASEEVSEIKHENSEVAADANGKIEYSTEFEIKQQLIRDYDIPKYDDDNVKTGSIVSDEYISSPFLDNQKSLKKRKKWLAPVLVLAILLVFAGLYFLVPSVANSVDSSLTSVKNSITDAKQSFSMTEMFNTVSKWVEPKKPTPEVVVVPKSKQVVDSISDSIANPIAGSDVKPVVKVMDKRISTKKTVDSLQLMLDGPRIYKKFIGSERITSGSRLTLMSKKYYKKSDFWVYIYEANKESIPNPDCIAAGTLIQIPKLDPRLIDVSNPKCIKKALELHDLYVKKQQ